MRTSERLEEVLRAWRECRVVVVGDLIADHYVAGEVRRISREAPVMIVEQQQEWYRPGGAANAAQGARALGASVTVLGMVGADPPGRRLLDALAEQGIDTHSVLVAGDRATAVKTRILAGGPQALRQQVLRVDRTPAPPSAGELQPLVDRLGRLLDGADAVLLSDYGHGLLAPALIARVREVAGRLGIPVTADSRYRLGDFRGLAAATPNQPEAEALVGRPLEDEAALVEAGRSLREALELDTLVITRGERGMTVFTPRQARHIPALEVAEVFDVTGAGDTVIATLTLGLAVGLDPVEAAEVANVAAGLVVRKLGAATVSPDELREGWRAWLASTGSSVAPS
ncbi:MAG: PfkB family carbohydrate kinase [Bacillota bacterium]|nr:PfkB family carbohydrate kinase [Bacillota bacterium]